MKDDDVTVKVKGNEGVFRVTSAPDQYSNGTGIIFTHGAVNVIFFLPPAVFALAGA